mmetsp:Transcript_90211/g.235121  ORF Transcript_90211/g.235121 Transcript_90211/m.235121 type:complete len:393 (-) Transcript_90211:121-1299(-)
MALGFADFADEPEDEGAGLISLEMGAFGSGSMNDPLRHAVGMRTAQDSCKMKMWNGFPMLFQNTIFHGEQDAEIRSLRHDGTLRERLEKGRRLKESGNEALKTASGLVGSTPATPSSCSVSARAKPSEAQALSSRVQELEEIILQKEQELKELREKMLVAKTQLAESQVVVEPPPEKGHVEKDSLEKAITSYEKAAGLLRYVECTRPDWKNDDGSYKGIEDQHLRVDASALEGDGPEAAEAKELVTSCYLNIALVCQKLDDFPRMCAACDEVLSHVNTKSVKALYRRAQARVGLTSALDEDRDAAIQDLHQAAQLAPQDKDVRGLLVKLKTEKKRQEASDRSTFAGMFDRGEVVTNDPRMKGEAKPTKWDLNDPRVQAMLDVHPGPGGFAAC